MDYASPAGRPIVVSDDARPAGYVVGFALVLNTLLVIDAGRWAPWGLVTTPVVNFGLFMIGVMLTPLVMCWTSRIGLYLIACSTFLVAIPVATLLALLGSDFCC